MTDSQYIPATDDDIKGIASQLAGILARGLRPDTVVECQREVSDDQLITLAQEIQSLSGRTVALTSRMVELTLEDGLHRSWHVGVVPPPPPDRQ